MSDRSRKLAEAFKAKNEAERIGLEAEAEAARIKDEKLSHDKKQLAAEAPKIWGKVAAIFRTQSTEFNAEPSVGNVLSIRPGSPPNQIVVVRADEPRELRVTFDSTEYTIRFSGLYLPKGAEDLQIKILGGDSEPSVVDGRDRAVDIESAVDLLLRGLLGL
jgi:vacuolar-type H+-ATPase subunit H